MASICDRASWGRSAPKFAVKGPAEALHAELVDAPTPPLRLPLGSNTLHAFVERETAAWRGVAASTDFPQGA